MPFLSVLAGHLRDQLTSVASWAVFPPNWASFEWRVRIFGRLVAITVDNAYASLSASAIHKVKVKSNYFIVPESWPESWPT